MNREAWHATVHEVAKSRTPQSLNRSLFPVLLVMICNLKSTACHGEQLALCINRLVSLRLSFLAVTMLSFSLCFSPVQALDWCRLVE